MKTKLLTLLTLLVTCVTGAWATGEVFYVKFQNSSNVTQSTANYFSYDKGSGTSVSWSSKGKHSCTYGGDTYSDVIKMESTTQCYFTSEAEATITIVQTISNATGDKLKFDGTNLNSSMANTTVTVNSTDKYNEYVITKVAAGTHTITRQSETGLAYVKVEYTGEASVVVADPVIAWNSGTSQATITCGTAGATIYYTTDGSEPTTSSATYSSAITLSNSTTVRTFAKKGDVSSNLAKRDCYVSHSSADKYLAVIGYKDGIREDATKYKWTSTDGNYIITMANTEREMGYVNLAGSQDGFKLNANDVYTLQPSEGIMITKIVIVGKTWLTGSAGNASTIALDDFTPASGTFYDYLTDDETYVKTIEFTPSTALDYGDAVILRPGTNQLGAYIEIYGDVKTYAITYNAGAYGTGTISAGEKTYGQDFTLSSLTFTRDGYVQTGWATSDGGDQAYALGDTYTDNADIMLYPVWAEVHTYFAPFSAEGTAGWTFSVPDPDEWADNNARVDYVKAFDALAKNTPKVDGKMNDNYVAFAKSTDAYAIYDLGAAATVYGMTAKFYGGSSSSFNIKIDYIGADGTTVKNSYASVAIGGGNWELYPVTKSDKVDDVRYIKIYGGSKWLVMSGFSVTTSADVASTGAKVTTNAGMWTSFTPTYNAELPADAKAYIITATDAETVTAEAVSVMKGGEGYFIKGNVASTQYTATYTTKTADATTDNMIVGCTTDTDIDDAGNDKYVLGTVGTQSGLFLVNSSITVTAGKAYLQTNSTSGARQLSLDFDSETTGIETMKAQKNVLDGDFFDLQGRKVAQPTKGLYIMNGKKVIIK